MLILDGVQTLEQNGPRFDRVGAPDAQSLMRLLNRLVRRILRRLTRDGLLIQDSEQPWLDLEPADALDQLNAASIRYRIAAGGGTDGRTRTLKNLALVRTDSTPKPGAARSRARCAKPVQLDSGRNTRARLDALEETVCEHTPHVTDPYDQAALQAVAVGLFR